GWIRPEKRSGPNVGICLFGRSGSEWCIEKSRDSIWTENCNESDQKDSGRSTDKDQPEGWISVFDQVWRKGTDKSRENGAWCRCSYKWRFGFRGDKNYCGTRLSVVL